MGLYSSLTKFEKRLLFASLLLVLLVVYVLFNDDILLGARRNLSGQPDIGQVIYSKNDTRHKDSSSLVWFKAKENQSIKMGDSIFTGANSEAQVSLKKGGVVAVGENSLIVFNEVQGEPLANINFGNFRIQSNGNLKLAINGKITTIQGKKSDLQVYIDKDKKSQIRLLHGEAKIQQPKQDAVELNEKRNVASLEPPAPSPDVLTPEPMIKQIKYTWRLYDLYQRKDSSLIERVEPPVAIQKTVLLEWSSSDPNNQEKIFFEHSQSSTFTNASELMVGGKSHKVTNIFLGENYWRVSHDHVAWSQTQQFYVEAQLLPTAPPVVVRGRDEIPLISDQVDEVLKMSVPFKPRGFVIQAAASASFEQGSTKTFWSSHSEFRLSFYNTGTYFYRFRAVNAAQELTDWSAPEKFVVFTPDRLPPPRISKTHLEGFVGDNLQLAWKAPANAESFEVNIFDEDNKAVDSAQTKAADFKWTSSMPGRFHAKIATVDKWGRKTPASKSIQMTFNSRPVVVVAKKPSPAKSERQVSSVDNTSSMQNDHTLPLRWNENYSKSFFEIDGLYDTYVSNPEVSANTTAPSTAGLGVHLRQWWDRSAFDGTITSDMVSANSTGSQISAQRAEALYDRRYFIHDPLGLTPEMQWIIFGGLQFYHNKSSGLFTTNYELVKVGTSIELPLWASWNFSANLAYGLGFDSSQQYEIGADFDYFLSHRWSLGLGYRIRLFQAGSNSTAASTLPFREGEAETFSSLKYYY